MLQSLPERINSKKGTNVLSTTMILAYQEIYKDTKTRFDVDKVPGRAHGCTKPLERVL